MRNPLDYPYLIFAFSLLVFWGAAQIGATLRTRRVEPDEELRKDFGLILAATLTLLGLIIGFTFSMAVAHFDLRKHYEEEEANAIGTEYQRADLLQNGDGLKLQKLLTNYLQLRMDFYLADDKEQAAVATNNTNKLDGQLWSAVSSSLAAHPTPATNIILSGMNDVLNSRSYTQAAWWNRVPTAAWTLLVVIAILCNLLIGYVVHGKPKFLFLVLPIALAVSFFLIADIDSPRGGAIRIHPQNLESLMNSLPH